MKRFTYTIKAQSKIRSFSKEFTILADNYDEALELVQAKVFKAHLFEFTIQKIEAPSDTEYWEDLAKLTHNVVTYKDAWHQSSTHSGVTDYSGWVQHLKDIGDNETLKYLAENY